MRRITLTLLFRDGTPVAELVWFASSTRIVSAAETLRSDLERLVEDGLTEWVGPLEDPTPRATPSSDQRFLERLAAYLRRQFSFTVKLQDSAPVRRRDTSQWPRGQERSLREPAEVG